MKTKLRSIVAMVLFLAPAFLGIPVGYIAFFIGKGVRKGWTLAEKQHNKILREQKE